MRIGFGLDHLATLVVATREEGARELRTRTLGLLRTLLYLSSHSSYNRMDLFAEKGNVYTTF
jgi:hypothetical protein